MFDTHCHLNFSVFKNNLNRVINNAKRAGVNCFVVPGTDFESSKRAIEIAEKHDGIYAAVGIHPHHVCQYQNDSAAQFFHTRVSPFRLRRDGPLESEKIVTASSKINSSLKSSKKISSLFLKGKLKELEGLLINKKVVAVGEVGIDKHQYRISKYSNYQITDEFIEIQKIFLKEQIKLAIKYNKSLIVHNREATEEILEVISEPTIAKALAGKAIFHCCEPDLKLLEFAKKHKIFIGVDGDVTYNKKKQEFIKQIPLELLVLETDSPYLLPRLRVSFAEVATKAKQGFGGQAEPLHFPNEPKNLPLIAHFLAKIMNVSINRLIDTTTNNAERLFNIK